MQVLARLTLRQMLTLPYVSLVLMLAATIGALSYFAARNAVDGLSGQLLTETALRISDALRHQVEGAAAVLDTAFPKGVPAPASITDDLPALRLRFWQATSIQRDANNYAYYANRQGQFFGLYRHGEDKAELRLRSEGSGPRVIRGFRGIHGALGEARAEARTFEPRDRRWFTAGLAAQEAAWTPVYIDFNSVDLVTTLSRPVPDASGAVAGVVATDLPLRSINALLQGLLLSPNALAYVVEGNGQLIALSRGVHLMSDADGRPARLHASRSAEPLVPATYAAVQKLLAAEAAGTQGSGADSLVPPTISRSPQAVVVRGPDATRAQVAYARLHDEAGLDWIIIVAVPQADVLQHAVQIFQNTAAMAVAASLAALLVGLAILAALARELRRLAEAARRVGEGQLDTPLQVQRKDEIGELARNFAQMQQRLLTDRLTGLSNREAALRRIDERIAQHRRRGDRRPFAVMFVDFNRFKAINDQYGHDVGDNVLKELALRLRGRLRVDDTVARYAGDEFLILLDAVADRRDAEGVRDQLEVAMREPLAALAVVAPGEASAGASFGIAMFPADGADIDTLIKVADQDMYKRKAETR
ncbi:diguanylate cyclase domain-containing protein [Aquabacterium sp.]|uniref:diguanylate cyclase domain-containing protein n=1 Tax=Aquabacterium sp. TaxID=1872578 RepID=UPI002B7E51CD|nr:diguanylate cyclase [Aquabacterium sp.]HSW08107.1 diguanylate cyclase [Aquabacterium sp.]